MSRLAWLPAYGCLTLLCAVTSAKAAPSYAAEQPATLRFSIPAQSLSTALIAFGKQANVQVLTAGRTIDALRSTDVSGALTAEAALTRLLQGTGAVYTFVDARTVVIKPREAETSQAGNAKPLSKPVPVATLLPPIQAIGLVGRDVGFMADVSSGPTRTVSDPIDVPQSVGIVTQSLLQSQQLRTVADAVQNVSGAQYVDGSSGLPIFEVRGFFTGNGMTDGLPNNILGIGDSPPLIGVERVEVLKGPQAILGDTSVYNNFGGLIDVVLKKPQAEPVREFTFSIGDHGQKQAGVDLAGPLNDSHSWSYRLILNGDVANDTVQGMRGQRNRYVAPSIGWTTPDTTFIGGVSWMMNHMPIPDHVILLDDTLSSASPRGLLLDNPDDHTAVETRRLFYLFEHRFNDNWTFRSRAQYVRESIDLKDWLIGGIEPTGDVNATAEHYRSSDAYYVTQNDVAATFGKGWLQHSMVLGFDYSRVQVGSSDDALSNGGGGMPYNIFTGGALPLPDAMLSPSDYASGYSPGSPWVTDSGIFLQDRISLGSYWEVLMAVRRAAYELQTSYPDGTPWNQHKAKWVPNFGVVYKLTPDTSIYANTSNGFQPDTLLGKDNHPLPPSLSRQIELGAKFDVFQNRARLTVAAYRIMLDHSTDLISLQPPYYVVSGPGQSNKGVEVEFNGQVAPGMDLSAAYTYSVIRNNDGTPATSASRQRFNVWASYTFQYGLLRGFGLAGGVLARSRSLTQTSDFTSYIRIPGQADASANVFYRAHRWSVTLGVKNLFDRQLYGTYFDETFVPLRYRRTYMLSGAVDF
ncbi:TonB-dependent siderophore receptor [Dyella psychrodurans]|uniref:TonB-dependent siderophore receptor n=1 Tax=Dyella psychrodurans TaxID=1927960 RepID=A0A370X548_9GAMM|nr:TonB-dependent receptor [Dyella psychrodurans]RDS83390.1 TonB-dependent siderophore receptor [Dyella psychrodurans]